MLIEDTDESVRAATIKSIAINTVYIFDSDKYAQVTNVNFILFIYIIKCVLIILKIYLLTDVF